MATSRRRFRSGGLPASCTKSGVLFDFGVKSRDDNGLGIKDEIGIITRTVKGIGVRRLAARTAGAMEEMDMVVTSGE